MKPSLCGWGAFCKSGVYARTASCLTTGDLSGALEVGLGAGQLALNTVEKSANGIVGMRQVKLLRHSKLKGGATDRPNRKAEDRRPARFPARGLKERRSHLSRRRGNASVEQHQLLLWDETAAGKTKEDAPVEEEHLFRFDLICRTAVSVTRMYGGVGVAPCKRIKSSRLR